MTISESANTRNVLVVNCGSTTIASEGRIAAAKPFLNPVFGLPLDWSEFRGYRKFGFHGASHRYVSFRAARLLGKDLDSLRLVTRHLGGRRAPARRGIAQTSGT